MWVSHWMWVIREALALPRLAGGRPPDQKYIFTYEVNQLEAGFALFGTRSTANGPDKALDRLIVGACVARE